MVTVNGRWTSFNLFIYLKQYFKFSLLSSKLSNTYWTFYYICKILPPLSLYSAIFTDRGWFPKDCHHFPNPTLPKFDATALKIVTVVLFHFPIVTFPHIGKLNSWKGFLKMLFLSFTGYAEQACRTKVLMTYSLTIDSTVRDWKSIIILLIISDTPSCLGVSAGKVACFVSFHTCIN